MFYKNKYLKYKQKYLELNGGMLALQSKQMVQARERNKLYNYNPHEMNIVLNTKFKSGLTNKKSAKYYIGIQGRSKKQKPIDFLDLVKGNIHNYELGYRDGVITVRVPVDNFRTKRIQLQKGNRLYGEFNKRSFDRNEVIGRKLLYPADELKVDIIPKRVDIVLYNSIVLGEDGDNSISPERNNWEIISILTSLDRGIVEPLQPETLLYNHFNKDIDNGGGTNTEWDCNKFEEKMKESFLYWRDKI